MDHPGASLLLAFTSRAGGMGYRASGDEGMMRWKTFACAGLLPAVFGGCSTVHNLVSEHRSAQSEDAITRELHRDARCAWREVRSQFARRMFTEEFHDGFLDGYTDYLDRGGNASPPLVPPAKYTRNKKYFTPEGQALLKDYFLGFKYGTDVAVATGCRQFLTIPVLLPFQEAEPQRFNVQSAGVMATTVQPMTTIMETTPSSAVTSPPRLAKPTVQLKVVPQPQPLRAPKAAVAARPLPASETIKFAPSGEPAGEFKLPVDLENLNRPNHDANSIPVPIPPIPLPPQPVSEAPRSDEIVPASYSESKFTPDAPPQYRLPEPPAEVGELPQHVPTPSVLDELPRLQPSGE